MLSVHRLLSRNVWAAGSCRKSEMSDPISRKKASSSSGVRAICEAA